MTLDAAQTDHFKSHGYLVVENFFTPRETDALRAEVERLQANGKLNNVCTEGDGKTQSQTKANLQLCPMYQDSDLYRALPFHPKVMTAVSALIGDPYILHLDQVFLKPAGTGQGTNWHQDNAYFQINNPLKGTAMWIATHDATIENGTIRLIPDMFNQQLEHSRDPMSNHHIRCFPDESTAISAVMPKGSAAFFCYGTPHATGANKSSADRAGLAYHFLNCDHIPEKLKLEADRNYNPAITGLDASGGENEYGQRVQGTWEHEVDQALTPA